MNFPWNSPFWQTGNCRRKGQVGNRTSAVLQCCSEANVARQIVTKLSTSLNIVGLCTKEAVKKRITCDVNGDGQTLVIHVVPCTCVRPHIIFDIQNASVINREPNKPIAFGQSCTYVNGLFLLFELSVVSKRYTCWNSMWQLWQSWVTEFVQCRSQRGAKRAVGNATHDTPSLGTFRFVWATQVATIPNPFPN